MALVVALCGLRRSGKDTVASHLCDSHGFIRLRFAKYLKDMLRVGLGLTDEHLEGDLKDAVHPVLQATPRSIMQFIGTEVMQYQLPELAPGVGRDVWARRLAYDMSVLVGQHGHDRVVVSDMRFPHELDVLKRECDIIGAQLKVVRIVRGSSVSTDTHSSEVEQAEICVDYVLSNDGCVETLNEQASKLIMN